MVEFTNAILTVLDKHALIKRKFIRGHNSAFMTKYLRAAIMPRSKLRQKFLKENFRQINVKVISNNRKLWPTISPLFSEKNVS